MHNTCWDMFVEERDKATRLHVETYEAVFDSCVSHARISPIVEVGQTMESLQAPARSIKPKLLEHPRRARMVLNIRRRCKGLVGWLVGWLFGWLVGWLVGWLMESLYSYAGGDSHKDGASTP
jgi:hypothetical protein